ncbi:MAG: hypothetical protein KDE01_28090, partial [Caldilineaceae bacterium]|nr:hypothetical protein [Caldilineaceae bacterium]
LKAQLNLATAPLGPAPTAQEQAAFADASQAIADRSITVLRGAEQLPLQLTPGAKVLTVTVAKLNPFFGQKDLEVFDAELRARGFTVE